MAVDDTALTQASTGARVSSPSVTWYLIKYVPDLVRREPINVGVVAQSQEGWVSRFYGINGDHRLAKRIGRDIVRDNYQRWIEYFQRKATDDLWPEVLRHQDRRAVNYYAERGGAILSASGDLGSVIDGLFADVVARNAGRSERGGGDAVQLAVREVFKSANIQPEEGPSVRGLFAKDGRSTEVRFDYGYSNGQLHLMDTLRSRKLGQTKLHVSDMFARMSAAQMANSAQSFVVFYSGELIGEQRQDDVLLPVERLARTVNVDDIPAASTEVGHLMAHA